MQGSRLLKAALLCVVIVMMLLTAVWFFWLRDQPGPKPEFAGRWLSLQLPSEHGPRQANTYIPGQLAPKPPLILALHGSLSDGMTLRQRLGYRLDVLADQHGFVVSYPDGFENHWNDCRKAAPYSANEQNVDDIAFLSALIDSLRDQVGISAHDVYALGFSNGGHMVYRLALERPEMLKAGAAIAANLPALANLDCGRSGQAVPMAIINGTEDPMNPFTGGQVGFYGYLPRGEVWSALETAQYWARTAGYLSGGDISVLTDTNTEDGSQLQLRQWFYPGRVPVRLLEVQGGGHTIPVLQGRMAPILGPTNNDIDTAEWLWRFFLQARGATGPQ